MKNAQKSQAIQDAALMWFVQLQDDNITRDEKHAFELWLDEAPEHRLAFEDVAKLWNQVSLIDELVLEAEQIEEAKVSAIVKPFYISKVIKWLFPTPREVWIGAGLVSACALFTFALLGSYESAVTPEQIYTSSFSGNEKIELADGSTVMLSGQSSISVSFDKSFRRVTLTRGAAHFKVAKDADHPFVVAAADLEAVALGTAFEVRLNRDNVRVAVDEGRVRVSADPAFQLHPITLAPMQSVSFINEAAFSDIEAFNPSQTLQWMKGRLEYNDVALVDIIRDVNRYRDTPIILEDDTIGDLKITASFSIKESDKLLTGLDFTHNIHVRNTPSATVLSMRR